MRPLDGDPSGPLAAISCEPRQARKGAAVAMNSGAEVRLEWVATIYRRGVRAVEGARLESVYGVKLIEGSNPSLSARTKQGPLRPLFRSGGEGVSE